MGSAAARSDQGPRRPNRPWLDRDPRPGGPRRPGQWDRPGGPGQFARPGAPAPPLEEGEELVAGRRPVEETFAAGRPALRLLVTPQRRQALERIVLHATTLRIPIVEVEGGSLTSLAGFDGHQGVAVVVEARRFASVDDILARSIERAEPAFVLVLDSLEDPQNVGTLLRSAEAAGVHGVIFPTERQAPLSPAAVKASAGATEHLLLAPVDDLAGTLTDLHLRGLRVVGSDAEASLSAREADLRGPIAIVIGSEGHGLAPAVRRRSDMFVRIPMRGVIGSLNAAVAGSVLLFEALGQRDPGARPSAPPPPPRPTPRPVAPAAAVPPDPPAEAGDTADAPDKAADPGPEEASAPDDLPTTAERPATRRTRTRLTAEDLDVAVPAPGSEAAVPAAEPGSAERKAKATSPGDAAVAARPPEPQTAPKTARAPGARSSKAPATEPKPKAARSRKASVAEPASQPAPEAKPKAARSQKAAAADPVPEVAPTPRAPRTRKAAPAGAAAAPIDPTAEDRDDALLPEAPPKRTRTKGSFRRA